MLVRSRSSVVLALAVSLAVLSPRSVAQADILDEVNEAALAVEWQVAATVYGFLVRLPPPAPWSLRKRVVRTLTIDIAAPLAHVFDVYSDIDNHIGRHPFLKAVVTHGESFANGVHTRNFTAIEDVPVAGIPVRLHTHAQQRIYESQYRYESDSYDTPDVITHQNIDFVDLGNGVTRVTEVIVFETNAALIDFTVQNGVAAHEENMAILKADIESGAL